MAVCWKEAAKSAMKVWEVGGLEWWVGEDLVGWVDLAGRSNSEILAGSS